MTWLIMQTPETAPAETYGAIGKPLGRSGERMVEATDHLGSSVRGPTACFPDKMLTPSGPKGPGSRGAVKIVGAALAKRKRKRRIGEPERILPEAVAFFRRVPK